VRQFRIRQKLDKDGEVLYEEDEDKQFKVARPGDHSMIPFQCELCHFRNISLWNPDQQDGCDLEILDMMRRANLDAFWSREKTTVSYNLQEALQMEWMTFQLGLPTITPPMGPGPLEDNLGMKAMMVVLDRSLNKGVYEDTVQWDTFWQAMSIGSPTFHKLQ
jgi:hypothetical protein